MINWTEKISSVAIDRLPKRISPSTHAIIDYGLAAATAGYALMCWKRNKAAAAAALMAAMAEVTNVAITDIPGGICKEISFPLHGRIDMGLTAMLTAMPQFMGFANEPESKFFYASALATSIVTSMTDYTGTGELAQSRSLLDARE
jgi:hypothetical protein